MKVAWFTPFSRKSAIGRFSQGVVAELSRLCEVEVFCFDVDETHAATVPVRKYRSAADLPDSVLARFDAIFYNLGNYLPYHRDIFEVSQRCPGIIILHDFVLHHFFAGYFLEHLKSSTAYLGAISRLYGEKVRKVADASLKGAGPRLWESDEVIRYPLFEAALPAAQGVITHSEFLKIKVDEVYAGPTRRIPLPYAIDVNSAVLSRRELGVSEDAILLLTVGHVNPNKRIASTIEALAAIRDRVPRFEFVVAGACTPDHRRELESLVRRHKLNGLVTLLGEVSDAELRSYLSHADICLNLRFPPTEGASASAIEEMLFGKPIIVADLGFYAELPEDCVIKINPQSAEELQQALAHLALNPGARRQMGQSARQYAEAEFRADKYAAQALDLVQEVRRSSPLLELADKLVAECRIIGVSREMGVVQNLAVRLGELFGEQ